MVYIAGNPIHRYETVNEGFRKRSSFGITPASRAEFAPADTLRENITRERRERSQIFEPNPPRLAPERVQPEDQSRPPPTISSQILYSPRFYLQYLLVIGGRR